MSEFPLFDQHRGVWEGTYTLLDREGRILDRHRSRLTCRREGGRWSQVNEYTWEDGRRETKTFDGTFREGKCIFDTPRLKGEAVEADEKTIVLRWKYTHEPENEYNEIISLVAPGHRCRTWQHIENGEFRKLTVIDERKVG